LLDDAVFAAELLEAEGPAADEDGSILSEALASLDQLEALLVKWEVTRLLSGPYDEMGAILTITAGAGRWGCPVVHLS
jgi:peptide chain release factor 2